MLHVQHDSVLCKQLGLNVNRSSRPVCYTPQHASAPSLSAPCYRQHLLYEVSNGDCFYGNEVDNIKASTQALGELSILIGWKVIYNSLL